MSARSGRSVRRRAGREVWRRTVSRAHPEHARLAPHRMPRLRSGPRAERARPRARALEPRCNGARASRLHADQRRRYLHGSGRSRARRRSARRGPPHRAPPAAFPVDDLALRHPLLRQSRRARPRARRPAGAASLADECLGIAVPTRSRKYESRAWRLKGRSALLRRSWDDAEAALTRALAIATEIGEPRQMWQTHAAIAALRSARGRAGEAEQSVRQRPAFWSGFDRRCTILDSLRDSRGPRQGLARRRDRVSGAGRSLNRWSDSQSRSR